MMPLLASSNDIPHEVIPIVAILCTFAWLIIKAVMSPFGNRGNPPGVGGQPYRRWRGGPFNAPPPTPIGGLSEEEQAILLKLQQTLTKMESRIESLETILIDQSRTNEKYGTKH